MDNLDIIIERLERDQKRAEIKIRIKKDMIKRMTLMSSDEVKLIYNYAEEQGYTEVSQAADELLDKRNGLYY